MNALLLSLSLLSQDPPAPSTTTETPPASATSATVEVAAEAAAPPPSTATTTTTKAIDAVDPKALERGAARARAEAGGLVPVVLLDLRADGVEPAMASAVSSVVGSELQDLGVLQLTTEEDVRRMMDFDQMKLILACQDEAKCLSNFESALGAEMLVTGTVGKAGEDVVVGVTLTDLKAGVPVGRETATVSSPAALVSELRVALGRLFRPVLARRGGTLVVLGNEAGATVLIDGAAVGVTPLRKDNVPGGPHRVEAVKDGFLKGSVDVTVQPAQTTAVDVLLIPSQELSEKHKRDNLILRVVSGAAAGTGALALGAGAGVWWLQHDKLTNPETGYITQYAKTPGGELLLPKAKYDEISRLQLIGYTVMGASVPLFITSGVLWFVSEDPAKYDALIAPPPAP